MKKEETKNIKDESVFEKIGRGISNGLLFIVLLPFNLFKYLNLAFYYIMKLMIRESPEKEKQRRNRKRKRKSKRIY